MCYVGGTLSTEKHFCLAKLSEQNEASEIMRLSWKFY